MKKIKFINITFCLLVSLFLNNITHAAPVQWNVNGHWYEMKGIAEWGVAKSIAESSYFNGMQGHLASISNYDENQFVWSLVDSPQEIWVGGYQTDKNNEPDGGWTWVTGEAWNYTNWRNGEPNDVGGVEDHLAMDAGGVWNDRDEGISINYIVEYEPTVVPEPISSILFITGGVTLFGRRFLTRKPD